jgi:hypothetical protein
MVTKDFVVCTPSKAAVAKAHANEVPFPPVASESLNGPTPPKPVIDAAILRCTSPITIRE